MKRREILVKFKNRCPDRAKCVVVDKKDDISRTIKYRQMHDMVGAIQRLSSVSFKNAHIRRMHEIAQRVPETTVDAAGRKPPMCEGCNCRLDEFTDHWSCQQCGAVATHVIKTNNEYIDNRSDVDCTSEVPVRLKKVYQLTLPKTATKHKVYMDAVRQSAHDLNLTENEESHACDLFTSYARRHRIHNADMLANTCCILSKDLDVHTEEQNWQCPRCDVCIDGHRRRLVHLRHCDGTRFLKPSSQRK